MSSQYGQYGQSAFSAYYYYLVIIIIVASFSRKVLFLIQSMQKTCNDLNQEIANLKEQIHTIENNHNTNALVSADTKSSTPTVVLTLDDKYSHLIREYIEKHPEETFLDITPTSSDHSNNSLKIEPFLNGSFRVSLSPDVSYDKVVIIYTPQTFQEWTMLCIITSAILGHRPSSLKIIIPYYFTARQERSATKGEVPVGIILMMFLINSFSNSTSTKIDVKFYYLHAVNAIHSLFRVTPQVKFIHTECVDKFVNLIKLDFLSDVDMINKRILIATPDAGRQSESGKIISELKNYGFKNVDLLCVNKHRDSTSTSIVGMNKISSEIANKYDAVYVIDDIIGTSGSTYKVVDYLLKIIPQVQQIKIMVWHLVGEEPFTLNMNKLITLRPDIIIITTNSTINAINRQQQFPNNIRVISIF
jgi:phosphoribosylpyrophosphate synthetase